MSIKDNSIVCSIFKLIAYRSIIKCNYKLTHRLALHANERAPSLQTRNFNASGFYCYKCCSCCNIYITELIDHWKVQYMHFQYVYVKNFRPWCKYTYICIAYLYLRNIYTSFNSWVFFVCFVILLPKCPKLFNNIYLCNI